MSLLLTERDETPMPRVPPDYRGPLTLPSGRVVWWTGRVAIGIRHDAPRNDWPSRCALWLQSLLTTKGNPQ